MRLSKVTISRMDVLYFWKFSNDLLEGEDDSIKLLRPRYEPYFILYIRTTFLFFYVTTFINSLNAY